MTEILLRRIWKFILYLFTPAYLIEMCINLRNDPINLSNILFEVFESLIILILSYYTIKELIKHYKTRYTILLSILILLVIKESVFSLNGSLFLYIVFLFIVNIVYPKFIKKN